MPDNSLSFREAIMLKSICGLVLAMSAFAGSLAADTQQQCSDVVPDVNLARNDPPKEVEGVTIKDGQLTLKPGYKIGKVSGNNAFIESIAKKRYVAVFECNCTKAGSCDILVTAGETKHATCKSNGCKGQCGSTIKLVDLELK